MILLIDNYDSFSYNLYQYLGTLNPDIKVIRNDAMTTAEIEALNPSLIILSPGPGKPSDAGVCEDVVRDLKGKVPILGVCLGHQAICESYGATVSYAKELMHGKQSVVQVDSTCKVFHGFEETTTVGRYHSLAVLEETLPSSLKVVARADDGEVMAVADEENEVYGLQFHPESIMTPCGMKMLENLVK